MSAREVTISQLLSTKVLESKRTTTRTLRTYIKKSGIKKRHRDLATVGYTSTYDVAKHRPEDETAVDFVRRSTQSTGVARGGASRNLGLGEQRGSRRKRIFYDIGGKGGSGKGGKGKGGG